MACRGVYFALTDEEAKQLLALRGDEAVLEFIQEGVESRWDEEWLREVDKAWDAIHRCLSGGDLSRRGRSALEKFVLGGKQLHAGSEYIISFLTASEVRAVLEAVAPLEKQWFRDRYFSLKKTNLMTFRIDLYDGPLDEEDFEYSWSYFDEARTFFRKVADAGRSLIFSVDQ